MHRSISKHHELAYYVHHSAQPVPLAELVRVAGSRRAVEEAFQLAKNNTMLEHHQVRHFAAWHCHNILSKLAASFLAVIARTELLSDWPTHRDRHPQSPGVLSTTAKLELATPATSENASKTTVWEGRGLAR